MDRIELIKKRIEELKHDKEVIEKDTQTEWYSPYTTALNKELIFFIKENIEALEKELSALE